MNEVIVFVVKDVEKVVFVGGCCCFYCFVVFLVIKWDKFVYVIEVLVIVWCGLEVLYNFFCIRVDS